MRKYSICFLSAVIILLLAGSIFLLRSAGAADAAAASGADAERSVAASEEAPDAPSSSEEEETPAEELYRVVMEGENICVYRTDSGKLYEKISAKDLMLPEEDLIRLNAGIRFEGAEELYQYLESLTS